MMKLLRLSQSLALLFLASNLFAQGNITDSFDDCSSWSVKSGSYSGSTITWSSQSATCSNSKGVINGGNSTDLRYFYRNYNFTAGNKYVIKVTISDINDINWTSGLFLWDFAITAMNTFTTTGTDGVTVRGVSGEITTTTSPYVIYAIFIPAANYSVIALHGSSNHSLTKFNIDDIQINENPCQGTNATITGPAAFCESIATSYSITPGVAYLWSNGVISGSANFWYSVGSYAINGYVLDSNGCLQYASKSIQVNARPAAPTISASKSPDSQGLIWVCNGDQVTLTSSSVANYSWKESPLNYPGTADLNVHNQSITIGSNGASNSGGFFWVETTDGNGCTSASNEIEVVTPKTWFYLNQVGSANFYQGGSVTFSVPGNIGNYQFQWSLNGSDISGATGTTYVATQSGSYAVRATNATGCPLASLPVTVTVYPTPTLSPDGSFHCGPITLTASSGSAWQWSTGATTQTIYANANGTYSVRVQQTYDGGFTIWSSWISTNVALPQGSVHTFPSNGKLSVCATTVQIETNSSTTYWSNGVAGQSIYVSSPGTYTASVMDNNGCWTSVSATITTYSDGTIGASPSTNICHTGGATLTAPAGSNWSWSGAGSGSGQTITATEVGTYYCAYTNEVGCSVTRSIKITRSGTGCTNFRVASDSQSDAGDDAELNAIEFGIYPNPTVDKFEVVLSGVATEDCPITMYDMLGRLRQTDAVEKGQKVKTISVSNLEPGLYLVNIKDIKHDRQRKLFVAPR